MKKNEIVVGNEYVFARYQDYDRWTHSNERVRVTGPGQASQVRNRSTYGKRPTTVFPIEIMKDGEWVDGGATEARNLREDWDTYDTRQRERAVSHRKAAQKLAEDRRERARGLLDLIPAMRHAGIPDTTSTLFMDGVVSDLLQEHIPDCLTEEDKGYGPRITLACPLAVDIEEYVKNGAPLRIHASTLLKALR